MVPIRASTPPKKKSLVPNLMEKGLMVLWKVAGRAQQAPERKLHPKQRSPSKSAQAISNYARRMRDFNINASPGDSGFAFQVEEIWKKFLTRPGCPQFSTRPTSMTHHGSATTLPLPEDLCVGSETWKMTKALPSDTKVDGRLLPYSKSACEFSYPRRTSESQVPSPAPGSPVLLQSRPRKPWYISVIHEKDQCLLVLREEVQRLSELEVKVQKKDEELLALLEEREALKKQLKCLLKGKGQEALLGTGPVALTQAKCSAALEGNRARVAGWLLEKQPHLLPPGVLTQEEPPMTDRDRDLAGGSCKEEEDGLEGEAARAGGSRKGTLQDKGGEEEEEEEVKEEEDEEEGELQDEAMGRRRAGSVDDAFEEELMAQLEAYEHLLQEFQFQLEVVQTRYSLATGAITSLMRQIEFQESQLQKVTTENEMLQKELRERKQQLQAMSDKFSNLREDKKHQEVTGLIQRDNLLLQQQVWQLEKEIAKREQTISELEAKVSQLQTEVNQNQNHLQRRKQLQEEMQNKNEMVQLAEQQARVALESAQSRLERLRNKIIQAAFNTLGIKSLATEISDSDILEALQRVISERTDYYNQLKQKGVKVPPLQQSEILSSTGKSKKISSK
ncbi:coiled-coil domain-containing protein 27 [Phacochoerus africanus]|uniref:coiled-coil domain-containing protein 27 n=1 Tax=Phacochoerus africanus TaxID=41426 RepID=UPI001FD8FB66|nr:coiled-coil domain-containing protein 27 [Phacochoerus africanus]